MLHCQHDSVSKNLVINTNGEGESEESINVLSVENENTLASIEENYRIQEDGGPTVMRESW